MLSTAIFAATPDSCQECVPSANGPQDPGPPHGSSCIEFSSSDLGNDVFSLYAKGTVGGSVDGPPLNNQTYSFKASVYIEQVAFPGTTYANLGPLTFDVPAGGSVQGWVMETIPNPSGPAGWYRAGVKLESKWKDAPPGSVWDEWEGEPSAQVMCKVGDVGTLPPSGGPNGPYVQSSTPSIWSIVAAISRGSQQTAYDSMYAQCCGAAQ